MRPYARTVKPVTLQMHKIRNLLRPGQCSSVGKSDTYGEKDRGRGKGMDKGISSLGKIKGRRDTYGEKGRGRGKGTDKVINSDKGRDKRPKRRHTQRYR